MKRCRYTFVFLSMLIFFSSGCEPQESRISTETQKSFEVEFEKEYVANQTDETDIVFPTPSSTLDQETLETTQSNPAPEEEKQTETEVNPYLVYGVDFSSGNLVIDFEKSGPKDSIETKLVSPVNLGEFASLSEAFKVGEGYSVVIPDSYGNLILTIHSSYVAGTDEPLEAESLRFFLERWGKEGTWVVERNLNSLEGAAGEIKINGENMHFVVEGAIRVLADELDPDPALMLDIPEDTKIIGNSFLESARTETPNGDKRLIINFCGWGPEDLPSWKRYSYYRYIILFEIYEGELDKTLG